MRKPKNYKKRWTIDEDNYLEEKWGLMKVEKIAKKLGRGIRAIEHRAITLGLGGVYSTGEALMASEVAEIVGVYKSTVCNWIEKYELRARKVCHKSQAKYQIDLIHLTKWLEKNQHRWNANKMEEYALGVEPQWLKDKRKADLNKKSRRSGYTPTEDNIIVTMYKNDYTFEKIAKETGRTVDMIKHRVKKLRAEGKYKIPYKNGRNQILSKAV